MNPFRNLIRIVGSLPPEPLPDLALIDRNCLPTVVSEYQSTDSRFVILVTLTHDGLYRAYQFTWFTHADDDMWSSFWSEHALGIITDQHAVMMADVDRRLLEYEKNTTESHLTEEAEQAVDVNRP